MSHFLEILCLLIISVTKQSVYGSTHALVGNYSELNPKDCGITRFTPTLDYNCFKWHKNIVGGMKGRNATKDEVPWIVHLVYRLSNQTGDCTGAFIADHWVLTAAHCLPVDDPESYDIYPGIHSFTAFNKRFVIKANRVIKHPDYKILESVVESVRFLISSLNDIGLIELNKRSIDSIKPIKGSEQLVPLKSICLPQNNVFNSKQEFAFFGGWGQVNRYQWPLQLGIRIIYPPDDYSSMALASTIVGSSFKLDNVTLTCSGDSGGPLWQYYNGRAVIIGVYSMEWGSNSTTQCQLPFQESANFFVRVSKYIDWIKSVTQLN